MSKEDRKIIVVKKEILFGEDYFNGFRKGSECDYESRILANLQEMRRGDAEIDSSFKQPIGYAIVFNFETKKVFAYQRSKKDERYGEKRLQGKWSWGVGGHIEPLDTGNENPIKESLRREVLNEEINIFGDVHSLDVLGYINDDSNEVGKVHFGILYGVKINGYATPKDEEMSFGKMLNLNRLEEICSDSSDVESWSRIALTPLRELIK